MKRISHFGQSLPVFWVGGQVHCDFNQGSCPRYTVNVRDVHKGLRFGGNGSSRGLDSGLERVGS